MDNIKDILAVDRTKLANQRTLLAYIRTSFYFIGLGLTILGIESFEKLKFLAVPLFIISPIIILVGIISYYQERKKIRRMEINLESNK
ncbi:MAG: DUF202 domain-containing protein [Saprospiraceae bacterium]